MAEQKLRIENLLADRCQLKVHYATKNSPVYFLVVAKNGLKMQEAKGSEESKEKGVIVPARLLATTFQMELGRPVIDKTGLKGSYYVKLSWTSEDGKPRVLGAKDRKGTGAELGPSIFTAVQEQLGLKLESGTGPLNTLVIDHVEYPSPN